MFEVGEGAPQLGPMMSRDSRLSDDWYLDFSQSGKLIIVEARITNCTPIYHLYKSFYLDNNIS